MQLSINRVAFEIPLPQFFQNWFPTLGATLPIFWYGIIIVIGIAWVPGGRRVSCKSGS